MTLDAITAEDYGQPITATFIDTDTDEAADISAYTTSQVVFLRDPNGNISDALTAAFASDGSDGLVEYTPADGDIDEPGNWSICGRVTKDDAVLTSKWEQFPVGPSPT